jgi:undecaprenyl diphosphate synthase
MDGNRRWAEINGVSTFEGHKVGAENAKKIINISEKLGIEYLTFYAFSAENWKRPKCEVEGLMSLLNFFIQKHINDMHEKNIKIRAIGRLNELPIKTKNLLLKAIEKTQNNTRANITFAISYGGREEIVDAVKQITDFAINGKIQPKDITEDLFSKFLYAPDLPDPDLLIRTAGEMRISNFLLWQISYAELYISNLLWPDFSEKEFKKALESYSNRERRFGQR